MDCFEEDLAMLNDWTVSDMLLTFAGMLCLAYIFTVCLLWVAGVETGRAITLCLGRW
jgi:hypothetical protein